MNESLVTAETRKPRPWAIVGLNMVQLGKFTALLTTNSGGVQKEAFFYRVSCVTLRDETERVELVQAGCNRLAPPLNAQSVVQASQVALVSPGQETQPHRRGTAAVRIVRALTGDLL